MNTNANALNEALILETLRQVVDPEIDCNIVDLGLVYGVTIEGSKVSVQMTLTTPGSRIVAMSFCEPRS